MIVRRSFHNLRPYLTLLPTNQLTTRPVLALATRSIAVQVLNTGNLLTNVSSTTNSSVQRRFKKKKASKVQKKDDEDDEDDSDADVDVDDEVVDIGFTDRVIDVNANRFDVILKTAAHVTRASVDQAFFENRIRVNGYCLTKKSEMASEGDVIDLIKGRNMENSDNLDVSRVEIVKLSDIGTNTGRIKMKVRAFKKLTIENYTEDPYEGSLIAGSTKSEGSTS